VYRDGPTSLTLAAKKGDSLSILVENMGRVGYGSGIMRGTKVRDSKKMNIIKLGLLLAYGSAAGLDTSFFTSCGSPQSTRYGSLASLQVGGQST